MRKILVLLVLLSFSVNAYPFWIWSPKTQKWKNPKYSALATPYLQYKQAQKLFDEEKYKDAYREFKKLLKNYPDAKEAAEAQYFLAYCLEKLDKPYEAFLEYQKVIDSYPNSQRINEVVERQYNIGEFFLNKENKKLLGMSFYDFVEHPSIEIFNTIVKKVPYSEYAPRAQYKLGIILMQLGRYKEARDAFQKTIDNYSDSEWAAPAKYQLAIATSKAFSGTDYDSTYLQEASERLDEFIEEHPEAQISTEAQEQLQTLRNREAKKLFDVAQFYETQDQYDSASLYYQKIIDNYSDTEYNDEALARLDELEELIEGDITKEQLRKQQKQEMADVKKEEKEKLVQEKIAAKKAKRQEAIRRKEELIEQKKKLKQKRLEEIKAKKAAKEAARQERLKKKQELREKKLKEKQERITQKQKIKRGKIEKEKAEKDLEEATAKKIKEKNKSPEDKDIEDMYYEALALFVDGKYELSYDRFKEVQELSPNYKNSNYYIENIDNILERKEPND